MEMLDRALTLARNIVELPIELNLWQAQNIWYQIMGAPSASLTVLSKDELPEWDKKFSELGSCLSIDCASVTADDTAVAAPGD
jgi:hypothetical protein